MKNWNEVITASLFRLLGQSKLYPVYLDTLVTFFEVILATGKLTYMDAREKAEQVLADHEIRELPEENEFDELVDEEFKIGSPGRILLRLQKAGWLRRETDRLTGEDVIRFPSVTLKLLRAFLEISEGREMEYDARFLSILKLLTQKEIPQHRAISYAHQQMVELIDGVQGLNQQFASLRPNVEAIDHRNLAEWTAAFSRSHLKTEYDNLRLRNSPERWLPEIVDAARELQPLCNQIAEERLKSEREYAFDRPNPAIVRQVAAQIAGQLSSLEQGMTQIMYSAEELDRRSRDFTIVYTRRVHTAIASQSSEQILRAVEDLFATLRELPRGAGGGDVRLSEGYSIVPRFRLVSPEAISQRRSEMTDGSDQAEILPDEMPNLAIDEKGLEYLRRAAQYIGPKAVERYFHPLFGQRSERMVVDLLDGTLENALYIVRLIDCCSLPDRFGFEIAWLPLAETGEPSPTIANDYRWISNLTIRRRAAISTGGANVSTRL